VGLKGVNGNRVGNTGRHLASLHLSSMDGCALTITSMGMLSVRANGAESLRTIVFNLMLKRFNSTEVAERITNRIIEEAKHGEQHLRDYLRKNLEFTAPVIDLIADILSAPGAPESLSAAADKLQFPKVSTLTSAMSISESLKSGA
jgi:hypothetical protein